MIRNLLFLLLFVVFSYCFLMDFEEHRKMEATLAGLDKRIDFLQKQQRILATDIELCVKEK